MKKIIFIILITLSPSLFSNTTQIVGPYQSIIKDITFIDELQNIGFVATGNGLFKTINGGVNWSSINGDLPFQPYISDESIHTYTHPTQIIQTNDGKLIYTLYNSYKSETKLFLSQDGGNHWSIVPYPKPFAAMYIKLTKDNHLILNNGQCLYEKNNIYEEFNELSCPKSQIINYVNNKLIYASPSTSYPLESFKKSVDGGKTWIHLASFGRNLGTNGSIIDVNGKKLFIVKNDTEGQILASSIDEGMNWTIEYEISKNDIKKKYIVSLYHDQENEYVGFSNGSIYRIKDGSPITLYLDSNVEKHIPDFRAFKTDVTSIHSNQNIWIGTGYGLYKKSNDNDDYPAIDTFFDMNGFDVSSIYKNVNSDIVFVVQNEHKSVYGNMNPPSLYRSKNNGLTWERLNLDPGIDIINIISVDSSTVYAITNSGKGQIFLYKSIDNGDSWILLRDLKSTKCEQNPIIDNDQMYCSRSSSYTSLYDSDDKFHVVEMNNKPVPEGNLVFLNENEIVALDLNGFYKSNDRGRTWTFLASTSENCFSKLRNKHHILNNSSKSCSFINDQKFMSIQFIEKNLEVGIFNRKGNSFMRVNTTKLPLNCTGSKCKNKLYSVIKSDLEYFIILNSTVYKTLDGGQTWNKGIHIPDDLKISSLVQIDKNELYFIAKGENLNEIGAFKIKI
ncbi:TPA: hypothetical protein JBI12_02505 [Legionella pneumophila]|nr:hypothetical protein [Legionella pneumophila]